MTSTFYWKAGATLGLTGVGLGAFGAHGLAKHVDNDAKKIKNWEMAAHYQILHGLALLVVSSVPRVINPYAAPLMLSGSIAFSGTIYALTLNREQFRFLGPVTPLGGVAMIAGWAALLL
ncbi:hypothetical protein NQZ79_g6302 [Umbelopsis isabellina]|nr:hypothetical protein NQZ79_g6302 [Umbelopsis isabellina]